MRIDKEQIQIYKTALDKQGNEELYNNKDREKCPDCGYIKDGTACRKKCKGETGGRYSWLFFLIAAVIGYYFLKF